MSEHRVRMTPSQISHAEDLDWPGEMKSDDHEIRFEGRDLVGSFESLRAVARYFEQDAEADHADSHAARRKLRDAAERIRRGIGLDPKAEAAKVRADFLASLRGVS